VEVPATSRHLFAAFLDERRIQHIHTVGVTVVGFVDGWVAIVTLGIKRRFVAGLWGSWTTLVLLTEERAGYGDLLTSLAC
jgi:hypothetical protein